MNEHARTAYSADFCLSFDWGGDRWYDTTSGAFVRRGGPGSPMEPVDPAELRRAASEMNERIRAAARAKSP